jgi:hypothetical protein
MVAALTNGNVKEFLIEGWFVIHAIGIGIIHAPIAEKIKDRMSLKNEV